MMPRVQKTLMRKGHPAKKGDNFVFKANVPRKEWCASLKTWGSIIPSKKGTNISLLQAKWPHETMEKDLKSGWPPQNVLKECSKGISKVWRRTQIKKGLSTRQGRCLSKSSHHQNQPHGCHKTHKCGSALKSCKEHLQKRWKRRVLRNLQRGMCKGCPCMQY